MTNHPNTVAGASGGGLGVLIAYLTGIATR